MATELLPRINYALTQKGALYGKTYTLEASAVSPEIILPITQIYAIGIQVASASDLKIEATMATTEQIDADEAIWNEWDGASLFNPAVTAIKATNLSASLAGKFTLTVKGEI
ncbi:hypothetical protein KAR91_77085 [Candidatus Pacearchaeota archaeon]|nr:hypothetical protein [Candidatus Pacearchaeota archaeon]